MTEAVKNVSVAAPSTPATPASTPVAAQAPVAKESSVASATPTPEQAQKLDVKG